MLFLGLFYDTLKMSIEVPQDKLDSITLLVRVWLNTSSATKTALQSLIGKLAFVCACISPGRIFMQRMLISSNASIPAVKCLPIWNGGASS